MTETPWYSLHQLVLHLPVATTLVAAFFCFHLFTRYRAKGGGKHLLWWGIGMLTYGIGTFTEAYTTLFGWDPTVFRAWYVAGAFLGGYPLAQGSIYLLMSRRFANRSAWIVCSLIAVAGVLVFLTPLDLSLVETQRLSGRVIEWEWLRLISPFINLYAAAFLIGGAVVSAMRFRREPAHRARYVGNILIAVGALLPGIGGTMTRAGMVEALYVTELAGLLLIYAGYRKCIEAPAPAVMRGAVPRAVTAAVLVLLLAPGVAAAEATAAAAEDAEATVEDDEQSEETMQSFFATTTVTATGRETSTFSISTPVSVLSAEEIQRQEPANAAELLRTQPGVDVNGVGPNQARPVIRGQRGLRVLFLENGLRLNNPRRQTDFGEIPGLVDLESVQTVEVVRGPASVLYGSDAIGGVLNLISRGPGYRQDGKLGGSAGLRYGSAGELWKGQASVDGRWQRYSFQLGVTSRDSQDYEAAAGSFGDIRLDREAPVVDTGVRDESLYGYLGRRLTDSQELSLRFQRYSADDTGFGFVEPELLGSEESFRIRILYPYQEFERFTFGYLASALDSAPADSLEVQAYYQSNERQLANDIDISLGSFGFGAPESTVEADTLNFTDLSTTGLRAEAIKLVGDDHLVTYGIEGYEDESFNTDRSVTTTTLWFPFAPRPFVAQSEDTVANTPNATNRSYGLFAQDEIAVGERLKLTVGARFQNVSTRADSTPGWDIRGLDFEDDSLVGSVSVVYGASDNLRLVGSWGTAFRAPNIVERLFNGPTPEGAGFQILNPDLVAEESENVELGLKYLRSNAVFELLAFRNDIDEGIVQYFLGPDEIAALPAATRDQIAASGVRFVVQQRNIDRLRWEGVEAILGYRTANGWTLGGNYTHLDGKRIDSTNPPTGDTVSEKVNLYARYERPGSRWWGEYRLRHNGSQRANLDANEPVPPVGEILPSFTIHGLSGGVVLFERGALEHSLRLVLENLTDELYAEFSNATFFRPQPGRNLTASYRIRF